MFSGLDLARLADLPEDVLNEARRVSEKLVELEAQKNEESKSNKVAIRRKALLRVTHLFLYCWFSIRILLAHRLSVLVADPLYYGFFSPSSRLVLSQLPICLTLGSFVTIAQDAAYTSLRTLDSARRRPHYIRRTLSEGHSEGPAGNSLRPDFCQILLASCHVYGIKFRCANNDFGTPCKLGQTPEASLDLANLPYLGVSAITFDGSYIKQSFSDVLPTWR